MEIVERKEVNDIRRKAVRETSKRSKLNMLKSISDVLQLKLKHVTNKTVKKALKKLIGNTLVLSGDSNINEDMEKLQNYTSMNETNRAKKINQVATKEEVANATKRGIKKYVNALNKLADIKPTTPIMTATTTLKANRGRGD